MTISNPAAAVTLQGNGSTTQFAFNFEIPYQSDGVTPAIQVWTNVAGVVTQLTPQQYAVSGLGSPSGGYVVYPLGGTPLAVGSTITIQRAEWYTQPNAFPNTNFIPKTVETGLDWLEMQIQQLVYEGSLTVQLQPGDSMEEFPSAAQRAGMILGFDAQGNPIAVSPVGAGAGVQSFNGRSGAVTLTLADLTALVTPFIENEWPDPQLCIVDTFGNYTAQGDNCQGTIPAYSITGYTINGPSVTFQCPNTAGVYVNSFILVTGGTDLVLQAGALRVQSMTSTSITCTPEPTWNSSKFNIQSMSYNATTGLLSITIQYGITLPANTVITVSGVTGSGADIGLINGGFETMFLAAAAVNNSPTITAQLPAGKSITVNPNTGQFYTKGYPINNYYGASSFTITQKSDLGSGWNSQITSQILKSSNMQNSSPSWISDRPGHTQYFRGVNRVIIQQVPPGGSVDVYSYISNNAKLIATSSQNRAVGMAVVCLNAPGATAQCFINNGAYQLVGNIAGAATRTWISGNINTGGATIYYAGVHLYNPTAVNAMFILGEFTTGKSNIPLPDGSFSTPRAQYIRFLASVSPWVGASAYPVGNGFPVDWGQLTGGGIRTGTSVMVGLIEGMTTQPYGVFLSRDRLNSPTIFNPVMKSMFNPPPMNNNIADPNWYAFASGYFHLDKYGADTTWFYGNGPWYDLSFDLSGAILFAGP